MLPQHKQMNDNLNLPCIINKKNFSDIFFLVYEVLSSELKLDQFYLSLSLNKLFFWVREIDCFYSSSSLSLQPSSNPLLVPCYLNSMTLFLSFTVFFEL